MWFAPSYNGNRPQEIARIKHICIRLKDEFVMAPAIGAYFKYFFPLR